MLGLQLVCGVLGDRSAWHRCCLAGRPNKANVPWCLLQLEVFPDEEIRLVNANQVPDDDYASVFDGVAGKAACKVMRVKLCKTASPLSASAAAKEHSLRTAWPFIIENHTCGIGWHLHLARYTSGLLALGCVAAAGKRKAREVEIGFKDTALHGSTPPAAAAAAAAPEGGAAPSGCETGRASTPEQLDPQQQEQQP